MSESKQPNADEVVAILRANPDARVRWQLAGVCYSWSVLATGPDEPLHNWRVESWPDVIDRRGNTLRCRIWGGMTEGYSEDSVLRAVDIAAQHGVTLQLLCVHEPRDATAQRINLPDRCSARVRETYPVLYMADHGMRWQ